MTMKIVAIISACLTNAVVWVCTVCNQMYIAYVLEFAFSIKASYAFLLLELGLGEAQCMGYLMEDQVKENFS